ncbi:MAG: B12-binding domain-containing protein [Desulfococcaceae bacterium]
MEQNEITEEMYQNYFSSLISGKRLVCADIAEKTVKNRIPVKDIYVSLFQRALYKVGELWEHNKISVAAEHMATSITEGLMNRIYPDIVSQKRVGKKVIVSAVENEQHQVGAKMVADLFEINGWDAFYLGAGTPTHELIRFAEEIQPDVIGLSLSVYLHMEELEKTVKIVRQHFSEIPILAGGQAFRHGIPSWLTSQPKVMVVSSLNELEKWLMGSDE